MDIVVILVYVIVACLIFLTIAICLVMVTTGFKKTGRNFGGLFCLRGPPSCGKSYCATSLAIEHMRSGRKVFSNFPIIYNDGHERYEARVLTKSMILGENLNGSVLIIDEAHNWFWSRKFKEFTEEYKNWFSTLAQHEISLYYVVQHEDRVDTVINDCCNLFGQIEKTEIPLLEMPLFFTITWWVTETDMQIARTSDRIDPFHQEKMWFNRDVANAYNTMYFGKDSRLPYEGTIWSEYLAAKNMEKKDLTAEYEYSIKSRVKNKMREMFKSMYRPIKTIMTKVKSARSDIGARFDKDADRVGSVPDETWIGNFDESLLEDEK